MLGYLLARAGVQVIVLEKHADFLRDFRGDTVHPSTMEVMGELGLLDRFLELPHNKVEKLAVQFGEFRTELADLTHLPVRAPYIAMMPQWDFLSFLVDEAQRYPSFTLGVQCEVTGLIENDGRVTGVTATTPDGPIEIHADLVVGADGRGSVLRKESGLHIEVVGAPMDVLWFRISRTESDPTDTMGRFDPGRILVMINRNTYWQLAYVISKGTLGKVHAVGIDAFRQGVAKAAPYLADRMARNPLMGRREAFDRARRPADQLVQARPTVHRRCGACHVARRRRRHQPRHSGCGGGREHSGA